MISVPQSLKDILHASRASGKIVKGVYAQTITVSNFDGNTGLTEIDPLKWIYPDKEKTWVIVHREYKFNIWSHINLLHNASRELASLSFTNPDAVLIKITFVQHIFNAVQEIASEHELARCFLTLLNAAQVPSYNLSSTQKIQLNRLKKANGNEFAKLLKEKSCEGSIEHTAIAYENYGHLCPLYHIDPFPFYLGSIDKIPLPALALCLKMKRFAYFLTDNIDALSCAPSIKTKESCTIN